MTKERKEIYKTIKDLRKGDTFIDDDGYKCHVLTNLKEEEHVVFKYYGKNKKYWYYSVESYFWFELRFTAGKDGTTVGGRKPMKITKVKAATK